MAARPTQPTRRAASPSFGNLQFEGSRVRIFYQPSPRHLSSSRWRLDELARRTIIARGTKDEMDLVHWFFDQLDPPGPGTRVSRERVVAGADRVVRVQFPSNVEETVRSIRSRTDWPGVTVLAYRGVLAVRGPLPQVLEVERLVNPN